MKSNLTRLLVIISFVVLTCCAPVRPYQRVYLNDREMKMQHGQFEEQVQVYREGASGGGSKQGSGGCGCN